MRPTDGESDIRYLPVTNDAASAVDILAYSVVKVVGVAASGMPQVGRPDAEGIDPALLYVSGPWVIPANGQGQVTADFPALAQYDAGDGTPAAGEDWGTGAGSFKLRKGRSGFKAYPGAAGGLVVVNRSGGGSGGFENVTVAAAAAAGPGGLSYYDSAVELFTGATGTFSSGEPVWLVQEVGAPLTTGHSYPARRYDTATIGGVTRAVYVTVARPYMTGWTCDASGPHLFFS